MVVAYEPPQPTSANENVLRAIGRKIGAGAELTLPERLVALTAASRVTADNYGPGPEDMVLQRPELPEAVKGILANYIG